MFKIILLSLTVLLSNVVGLAQTGADGIYIKVGEAQIKKSLVAFPSIQFASSSSAAPQHQRVGVELYKVIKHDLDVTGYFDFIDPKGYLEDTSKVARFRLLRLLMGSSLIVGKL